MKPSTKKTDVKKDDKTAKKPDPKPAVGKKVDVKAPMKKEDTSTKLKTMTKEVSKANLKKEEPKETKEVKDPVKEPEVEVPKKEEVIKKEEDIPVKKVEPVTTSNVTAPTTTTTTSNPPTSLPTKPEPSDNKNYELEAAKKFANERKELGMQINDLTQKLEKEQKAHKETEKLLTSSMKEFELVSNNYQQSLNLQKDTQNKLTEANNKISQCLKEIADFKKEIEEKTAKYEDLELDFEITKEEFEGVKLEFEEYKMTSVSSQLANLDEGSAQAKVLELENQISIMTNAVMKSETEKNKEISLLKKEAERLHQRAKDADELPQRDEIIKILKETINNNESTINELKEQLDVFNSASSMIDDVIMEKNKLEEELINEKNEKAELKYEMETTDMLIEELENANKLNEKLLLDKEDEMINLNQLIESNRELINKSEKTADEYVILINQIKLENKTLREEMSKNSNVNVDDILTKNSHTSSQMKTLMRQQILPSVTQIDTWGMELNNRIFKTALPEGLIKSQKGLFEYQSVLAMFAIRRKVGCLSVNILENELLYEVESIMKSAKEGEEENIDVSSERLFSFLIGLIELLNNYFGILVKLECMLMNNNVKSGKFKEIMSRSCWSNIQASSQYINTLINVLKEDTFGIDYSSNLEGFKTLVKYIEDDLTELFKNENIPKLSGFYSQLSIKLSSISSNFSKLLLEKQLPKDTEKREALLTNIKSTITSYKKFTLKIETLMDYNNTLVIKNKTYEKEKPEEENDDNILGFFKIPKTPKKDEKVEEIKEEDKRNCIVFDIAGLDAVLDPELPHNMVIGQLEHIKDEEMKGVTAIEGFVDSFTRICAVSFSQLDKYEKGLTEAIGNDENLKDLHLNSNGMLGILPIFAWGSSSNDILESLEKTDKLKQDFDQATSSNIKLKKELLTVETQQKETLKSKEVNDRKLAEATMQLGKIAVLEMDNESLTMKIEKYNITVDDLMQQILQEKEKVKTLNVQLAGYQQQIKEELKPAAKSSIMENKRTHQRAGLTGGGGTNVLSKLQNHLNNKDRQEKISSEQQNSGNQYGHATESAQLLNTMIQLQREKKLLKIRLMKGKLQELQNENSFINKYIHKVEDLKPDLEMISELEDDLDNINKDYIYSRKKLVTPKVFDITRKDYNYEKEMTLQHNDVKALRVDYMNKIDKVFFNIFGNHSVDKNFKQVLDNTIAKSLDYFEQKKVLVARLNFNAKDHSVFNEMINSKDNKDNTKGGKEVKEKERKEARDKRKVIPVFVSESTIKNLNSAFTY